MKAESYQMHDWTLGAVRIDWSTGVLRLDLSPKPDEISQIIAKDFRKIEVPRRQAWGESVSVMTHVGPEQYEEDLQRLSILMQSGDSIEVVAREIEMPAVP